ncbi:iron ABC transporter substrate-binding protein [Micrococcoides hystricis]|uniref:Iron ABC transporter substrate-binding protein n=1 Tax=Micrococcoides hystricis TaxID=1572761 RepID=A0ABV6P9K5_9MICC
MRSLKRVMVAAIAAFGLTASMAACSTDNNGTEGANNDGPLVIYSGRNEELIDPLIQKFEEETGIKPEVRYAGSAEQAQLLLTEADRSPAHVFLSQEAGALGLVAQKDLLATLPEDVMSKVPAGYSSEDQQWVGLTGRARVVAYDKDSVDEADVPDTYQEMVDPKWEGKIGVAPGNASFLAFVTAIRVAEGDDAAREWLKKLAGLNPKTYEKNGHVLEAVNKGEVQLGLINHYYWYNLAAEEGQDNMRAQIKFGQDGDLAALVNATGVGIMKTAEDRDDARQFVDYLLSADGQEYFAEETAEYPLVEGVDGPEGVPPLSELKTPDVDLSELGSVDETAAMVDEAGLTLNK